MRHRAAFVVVLLAIGCPSEGEGDNPICSDCQNDDTCPSTQPTLNPLEPCTVMDAECFYCDEVQRRFVCTDNGSGNLNWIDNGEADMCPPPSMEDSGQDGDGGGTQ